MARPSNIGPESPTSVANVHSMVKSTSKRSASRSRSESRTRHRSSSMRTSSISKSKSKERRRVHFQVDENDTVQRQVVYYEKNSRSTKAHLFYTEKEMFEIVKEARVYGERIRSFCPEIAKLLECLFKESGAATDLSKSDMDIIRMWAASKGRGLEDCMSRQFKSKRESARARVLKFYRQLSKMGASELDRALRDRYVVESQKSREFAYKLAIGDEMEAQKYLLGLDDDGNEVAPAKPTRQSSGKKSQRGRKR